MSDTNITEEFTKITFREKSDQSEDENMAENGQEDIEAMKAAIKEQQKRLSAAQKKAEKSKAKTKTKPIVSLLVNYPNVSSKMADIRAGREPNNCCA